MKDRTTDGIVYRFRFGPCPRKRERRGQPVLKLRRTWAAALAVVMAAGLVLGGCGGAKKEPAPNQPAADAGKPVDGGTLTIGTVSDIVTQNPMMIEDTASSDLAWFLFAYLYDVNAKGEIEVTDRSIAAEMPKVSDDKKVYTIKLKSTTKWSDGSPLTADDVALTFNIGANEKVGSPLYNNFANVKEAKAVDPTTVQVTLKDVDARFELNALNMQPLPAKVFKDVKPEEVGKHPYGTDIKNIITSGPYVWKEWVEKQYHVLEVNPNYWAAKPHIQKVIMKLYADQNTSVQALVKGEVDLLPAIPVAQFDVVKGQKSIQVIEGAGPVYDYLSYNFNGENFPGGKSPFVGKKTRQAIAYALNRKGMVDSVLKGHGTILNGPFLPTSWANTPEAAKNFEYDPAKAKALLAEDGWKAGADGILAKDGQKFEFELLTNAGNKRREQYISIIQQNLADVGIKVNLKPIDFSALIQNNISPGKYQALLLGWQLSLDPDGESILSSNFYPPAGQNSGFYKNAKTDELWTKGYQTVDKAQRKAIYADILKEYADDPPYAFIAQQNIMIGHSDKVKWNEKDAPQTSLPEGQFFHIFDWWMAK